MADVEAAAARAAAAAVPPQAPAPAGAARRRAAAAEKLADAAIYSCLGAMWVSHAAGAVVVLARYAVGRTAYAAVVVRFARGVLVGGLVAAALLCPLTLLVVLLRIDRRRAEPPERVMLVDGVYATVQVHGRDPPAPRSLRQGTDIGLVPLLMFVFFSMNMLFGLLLQERLPASVCWEDRISMLAWISDIGSFACSAMVMFIVIPYLLLQVMILPK